MILTTRRLSVLALAFALPLAASAADYKVGPGSTLGFSGKFQGQQFDGSFGKFDAAISFDAANLATSKFDVTVDVSTAKTGDGDRDDALPGSDFFDTKKFATAHYVTTGFSKNAKGDVIANGNLTLHGVTKPVALKVAFSPNAGGARLSVTGTLKRLDFGVGSGEYKDTSTIADEVLVNGSLNLLPK
ncbi:polyisoprenoid-binding protein YceI [Luteibacter sp. OK325]|uniref:YceI family protein n=1 Tax=Luteibacter sp. OK325 TaxID=2135670 RepID=UPI000D34B011|nr:YceI family protein [Luteibacter sp. OK325]PTR28564.1 polyisoprenoid-binding protein YceI [Luteibacter sp. OK325]